jgi:DNA-binding transcriptional ArsR family regulator
VSDPRAAALRGDFRAARAWRAEHPDEKAWAIALSAMEAAATGGRLPAREEVAAFAGASPAKRAVVAIACSEAERAAFAAFDREGLESWAATHASLVDDLGCGRLWRRLVRGETDGLADEARRVETGAAKAGDAPTVVEAASLGALGSLAAGDVEGAVALARRASRMARTEALPQSEYLAHLVLARLRRVTGRPHLAARILGALARIASPGWQGWIAWEALLAGAEVEAPAGSAARSLQALFAARDRASAEEALAKLRPAIRGFADFEGEIDDVVAAIDPDADLSRASARVRDFLTGAAAHAPGPLAGPAFRSADSVLVLARPGRPARRVLSGGIDTGALPFVGSPDRAGRTEAAVAVLAFARSPLSDADFFRAVYGFVYSEPLHRGNLDVLVHRVRAAIDESAALEREAGLVLSVRRPFVVADPRAERSVDERILRALALRKGTKARDVAGRLGIPLRTVQLALSRLVDDGACEAVKEGRAVEYRVEDTTFTEPTNVK